MSSPLRTIVLWVVLLALFIGLYQFFSGPAPTHPQPGAWSYLPVALGMAVVVGMVLYARWSQRGIRTNNEGIRLLQQGRLLAATEKFELAARQLGKNAALAHFNTGIARLQLWQLEQAVAAFERAEKDAKRNKRVKLPPPSHRALAEALLGRIEKAEQTLASTGTEPDATRTLTQAVIAARQADFAKAFDLASALEVKQTGGALRGLAEALRAWSKLQLGNERWPVDRIALFGEAGPDLLRSTWPELVAFIEQAPS